MTGAVEGGVQVATGFMDALKREPLSLALVLMNMALLLFFYVILVRVADQRKEEIGLLYADKKEVRELLSQCIVPDKDDRRRGTLQHLLPLSGVPHVANWPPYPPLSTPGPSPASGESEPPDEAQ